MKRWLSILIVMLAMQTPGLAGHAAPSAPDRGGTTCSSSSATEVVVCPTLVDQTWTGWGTSLAWWGNAMNPRDGWSPTLQTTLADLVFSPSKGLGFTVVRYNIGAGIMPVPAHASSPYFRSAANVPGYEYAAGHWNWSADAFQRAMLMAAKQRGANVFEAFANSAPYWMTVNGDSAGNCAGYDATTGTCPAGALVAENLPANHDAAFAWYLANVVKHYHDALGITFSTIDPLNEPSGFWWRPNPSGNQEGAYFSVGSQARIIAALARVLALRHMPYTSVAASDENSVGIALQTMRTLAGDAPSVYQQISQINVHGYSSADAGSNQARASLEQLAQDHGLGLWMSEYTTGGDTSMSGGLTLAEKIMRDVTDLRPTAWVFWQALDSGNGYGLLHVNDLLHGGAPEITKQYWVMAQFSRYVRPGYRIIDVSSPQFTAGATYPNTLAAIDPTSWC